MKSLFNWNCCSYKLSQNKELDLNFEEDSPTPGGIMKMKSDDSNFELKNRGTVLDQKMMRAQAIKQLRRS